MSNRSNSQQLEKIITFMEDNSDFARGKLKEPKGNEIANHLWNTLTDKLNSLGPPMKTWKLWRKVWYDLKDESKKKLRDEYKHASGTATGSKKVSISRNHERIIDLLHIREPTNRVSGQVFGGAQGAKMLVGKNSSEEYILSTNIIEQPALHQYIKKEPSSNINIEHIQNCPNVPSTSRTLRAILPDIVSTMQKYTDYSESKLNNILCCLENNVTLAEKNLSINKESLEVNKKLLQVQQRNLEIKERQTQIKEEHFKLLKSYYEKKLEKLSK